MLPGQGAQHLPWTDLQENALGFLEQFPNPVGEPHRLPQMPAPVIGIKRLLGRDPGPANTRDVWNPRGLEMDAFDQFGERAQHRLHLGRVKRMRYWQTLRS